MIYSNPFSTLSEEKWNYLNHRTLQELQILKKEEKNYFAILTILLQRKNYAFHNLLFCQGRDRSTE